MHHQFFKMMFRDPVFLETAVSTEDRLCSILSTKQVAMTVGPGFGHVGVVIGVDPEEFGETFDGIDLYYDTIIATTERFRNLSGASSLEICDYEYVKAGHRQFWRHPWRELQYRYPYRDVMRFHRGG